MEFCHSCSHNYLQAISQFYENNESSLDFLKLHDVIPKSVTCPRCGKACIYRKAQNIWRCRGSTSIDGARKRCSFSISEFKNTFLDRAQLPPWKIVLFANHFLSTMWSHKTSIECLNIGAKISVEWRSHCSQVTDYWFNNHQPRIGGKRIEIEIDETIIVCKANKTGEILKQLWLFGGIERISKKRFVVFLNSEDDDSRNREYISMTVQKYIRPGSIIYSDSIGEYYNLSELGYKHYSYSAGNPNNQTGYNIEQVWRDIKGLIKKPGIRPKYITEYISRYLFMKSVNNELILHKFFLLCAELYPFQALKNDVMNSQCVEEDQFMVVEQELLDED